MSSKDSYREIHDFFGAPLSTKQKAWMLIDKFYHLILTRMEKRGTSRSQLAKQLGKSKSSVSQMFNKTPNISILKMVEIADAVGINLDIVNSEEQKELEESKNKKDYRVVVIYSDTRQNEFEDVTEGFTAFNRESTFSTSQVCENK